MDIAQDPLARTTNVWCSLTLSGLGPFSSSPSLSSLPSSPLQSILSQTPPQPPQPLRPQATPHAPLIPIGRAAGAPQSEGGPPGPRKWFFFERALLKWGTEMNRAPKQPSGDVFFLTRPSSFSFFTHLFIIEECGLVTYIFVGHRNPLVPTKSAMSVHQSRKNRGNTIAQHFPFLQPCVVGQVSSHRSCQELSFSQTLWSAGMW